MFQVTFNVSAAARKAAFEKDGQIWPETFTLKIDPAELTPQQRALILNETGLPANEGASVRAMVFAEGRDLQSLIAAIEKETAAKAQREAQREAREKESKAAKLEHAREAAQIYLTGGFPTLYHGYTVYPTTGDAGIDAAVLAEKARREAEIKEKEKARESEAEAKWQQMADWANEHGSQYLRRLIDGGYNWKEKCVKEWCEHHTPEGWADISKIPDFQEWWQIKNPSAAALDALDAAHEQHPNAEIYLYRAKFYSEDDGRYHADYLSITLTPPIGQGYSVEKFIEHYEPAE